LLRARAVVHPLKNILNRLRWDSREDAEKYLITYVHRGAPDDRKQVNASEILKLGNSYFTLQSESGEDVTIPFHRILEVRDTRTGTVVWKSRRKY
jgi:uncharacterized protein (UPF0248 family)